MTGIGIAARVAAAAAVACMAGIPAHLCDGRARVEDDARIRASRHIASGPRPGTTGAPPTAAEAPSAAVDERSTVHLPYADGGAGQLAPAPRVWGTQFILEPWARWHDADLAIELPRARAAGVSAIRTSVRWSWIEPANTTPDRYDWSRVDRQIADYAEEGFDVLVVLVGYPRWATYYGCGYGVLQGMDAEWREFVTAVVERYRRPPWNVSAWEIGNEPDGETVVRADDWVRTDEWGRGEPTSPVGGCWGDRPAAYAEFLRSAHASIKAVDPAAVVVSGSVAHSLYGGFHLDFLDGVLAAGGSEHFDVLGIHWYPDAPYEPADGVDRFRALVAAVAAHGVRKPVWLTETYRLTHPDFPHTEANQVPFLTWEIVRLLGQPELRRVYWYGWVDLPDEVSDGIGVLERGIVRADHTPKHAFDILPYTIRHTAGTPTEVSTDAVEAWRFAATRDGPAHLVARSRDGTRRDWSVAVPPGEAVTVLRFAQSGVMSGSAPSHTEIRDDDGDGLVSVAVGDDARLVEIGGARR